MLRKHFGSKESMQLWSDFYIPKSVPTLMFGELTDKNMPIKLLKPLERIENMTVCYLDRDHDLCHKLAPEMIEEVDRFFWKR